MANFEQPIEPEVFKVMVEDMMKMEAKMKMYSGNGKHRFILLEMIMKGTTFSGHPTRTSLGNGLRVIMYHLYALYKAGINLYDLLEINSNFGLAVNGDDAVGAIKTQYQDDFNREMRNIYSTEATGMHGLGQKCGEIIFDSKQHLNFVSKHGFYCEGFGVRMYR